MQSKPGPRRTLLLALLTLALGLLLVLPDSLLLQSLRNQQFDQFQRWHPRASVPTTVRVVDVDEASLQRLGQWPWPRTRLASLLDCLAAAGASVVAFDAVFAEPDRSAPRAVAALWGLQGAQRDQLLALPDPDQVFAQSLQQAPAVLGFALLDAPQAAPPTAAQTTPTTPTTQVGPPPPGAHFVWAGAQLTGWLHRYDAALPALPELQQAARGNGALSFVPDADGVVRRVPLLLQVGATPVPTLLTEALRVAQGASNVLLKSAGPESGLAEVRIGRYTLPTTPQGELWVHYSATVASQPISAWKLLQGQVPPEQLAGAVVLVGSSAQGLMDLRFGPLGPLPGVQVQAQALEQVLGGHYLQRPSWARGLEALVLVLGGALLGALALRLRALRSAAVALCLLALLLGAAWWAFVAQGLLLDAVTPALAWVLVYLLCSLWQHLQSEREQRWIAQAFARYVSPNRVAWLLAHPQAFVLGGKRQTCSFVFTDLTGFTGLMEGLDPAQAVRLLNPYLDRMVAIAFAHEGTLDRIVGDAVAIMFSAPVEQADQRARALACALEMDAFACGYAQQLQQQGIAFGQTRIGVHCGEVIVGNFGGSTLFDYRALGDPVNTAARLERVNKRLGTRVCISEDIVAGNPGVPVRPVGRLQLQGKRQTLAVFEPEVQQSTARAPLADYRSAYAALQAQAPQALDLFTRLAQAWPLDPLVGLHHERLLAGAVGDLMVMPEK